MIGDKVQDSAESLLARIKAGSNVGAAKEYNQTYAFARIWRLVVKLSNCPPEQKDLMVEYKCEIRTLLLLLQEMGVDLADAEAASSRFKTLYNRPGS